MGRLRVLGFTFVVALVAAGCGGDDSGDGDGAADPDGSAATTTAPPVDDDDADDDEEADDGEDADDGGDDDDSGSVVDPVGGTICELVPISEVSTASGVPLTEDGVQFSTMSGDDYEIHATGCSYEDDADAEVEVAVLDDDQDAATAYPTLLDASATSGFDDFAHAEVPGLGDGAFFAAGLRQEELVVLVGDTIVFVEGTGPDGETLGRAELQAVAALAVAALG
jgi:hypothetical protein